MQVRAIKYLVPFIFFISAIRSFHATYWLEVWLPMLIAWVGIPVAELLLKPDPSNMNAAEEEMARKNQMYDWLLYLVVPMQYTSLYFFLEGIRTSGHELAGYQLAGRIAVMGLLCGTFGINVAHELGHRVNRAEQLLAKTLLLTSLYMHFFTEHNKGHHKRVATPEDPSSARLGEPVYLFYLRTVVFSYLSAWHIAGEDCRKKGHNKFSVYNEMIWFQVVQLGLLALIYFVFGWMACWCFMLAALMGILLLETVNYIEHYGLRRNKSDSGTYERTLPIHSWNSDHVLGRVFLFELSRHSDHHYLASRKYQVLRHHDQSPQMPTGYPGMMLLSLVPPAWFRIMNPRVHRYTRPATPSPA